MLTKEHAALQHHVRVLREEMEAAAVTADAEARLAEAAAVGEGVKAAAEAWEEVSLLRESVASLRVSWGFGNSRGMNTDATSKKGKR